MVSAMRGWLYSSNLSTQLPHPQLVQILKLLKQTHHEGRCNSDGYFRNLVSVNVVSAVLGVNGFGKQHNNKTLKKNVITGKNYKGKMS